MIPKVCKSQFRTPFRGRAVNARSPLSSSQSQWPPLAETPNAVLACSQMSTPGITVDAIKTIVRTSPLRSKTARNRAIQQKPSSKKRKQNEAGVAVCHRDLSKGNESKVQEVTSQQTADKIVDGGKPRSKKARNIRTATKVTDSSVGEAHGAVFTLDHVNHGLHKGNYRFQRKSLPAENGKSCETGAQDATKQNNADRPKTSKVGVRVSKTKRKSDAEKLLQKYARTNPTGRDGDEVVVVSRDAYVYEEHYEEPPVPATEGWCDVYTFAPDSPEEHLTSKRARKEQIRLEVLKTIYRIETELAVFRQRRHKLRAKLMRSQH